MSDAERVAIREGLGAIAVGLFEMGNWATFSFRANSQAAPLGDDAQTRDTRHDVPA